MFSPAQMTLPIKLGPRLWEILYPSPAPPQFSWTTSEKSFNLQGSPILFLASEKLCQDAGCVREFLQWYRMQRLLWPGPIKVLQVKLGCVYTWPENCWTGWDWVNFEFRTRWQRVFLLVVHYAPLRAHSYIFQSCSQMFIKIPWSTKLTQQSWLYNSL